MDWLARPVELEASEELDYLEVAVTVDYVAMTEPMVPLVQTANPVQLEPEVVTEKGVKADGPA